MHLFPKNIKREGILNYEKSIMYFINNGNGTGVYFRLFCSRRR